MRASSNQGFVWGGSPRQSLLEFEPEEKAKLVDLPRPEELVTEIDHPDDFELPPQARRRIPVTPPVRLPLERLRRRCRGSWMTTRARASPIHPF